MSAPNVFELGPNDKLVIVPPYPLGQEHAHAFSECISDQRVTLVSMADAAVFILRDYEPPTAPHTSGEHR